LIRQHRTSIASAVLVCLIYLGLFSRSLAFGYFADDFWQNPTSWQTLGAAIDADPQFRPLFWLLYPLTRALLGETPFAGHLVNHALHLANCLLHISCCARASAARAPELPSRRGMCSRSWPSRWAGSRSATTRF
jgi:hypothetical protein